MKRTRLTILIALMIILVAPAMISHAQKKDDGPVKPDLEEIRVAVTDYNSPFYYPKLRKIYEKVDTLMTPEQFRYYYLGYLFQEDFNPYRESQYAVSDELANKETFTKADLDTIMKYSKQALLDNPFDLRQMSFYVYALKERGKDMLAKAWQYKLENILNTIRNTGTGESADEAWYVISPDHEYALINALNYTATGYDDSTPGIDYIQVQTNAPQGKRFSGRTPAGFYFNVKNLQEEYERKFGTEEE